MLNKDDFVIFIKNYWPFLFVVILDLIYLVKMTSLVGWIAWDFPGQLYQTQSSIFNLSESVYSFDYFLGYYPILYPPLVISLISILGKIFSSVDIYVITILLIYISRFVFFLFLYKTFLLRNSEKLIYIVLSFIFIATSLEFNTVSIWEGGTVASTVGFGLLSILSYYIYKNYEFKQYINVPIVGLLLGLIILTHTITASVAILFLLIALSLSFLRQDFITSKHILYSILIGLLIGMIWVVPYLDLNSIMPRSGIGGYRYVGVYILNFIILILLYRNYADGNYVSNDKILIFTGIILITIGMIVFPFKTIRIHNSRYLYYGLYFVSPFIILAKNRITYKKKYATLLSFLLITIFTVFFIQRDFLSRTKPYNRLLNFKSEMEISGRILDASSLSGSTTFPHAVNTSYVNDNENLVASGGLFVESAPNGIYALALRAALNKSAWFPLYNTFYKYYTKPDEIYRKFELLGINNIVTSSNILPQKIDEHVTNSYEIGTVSYYGYSSYYLYQLEDNIKLVEALTYHPENLAKEDFSPVERWAELTMDNLYIFDERISDYNDIDLPSQSAQIDNIRVKSNRLSFFVDGDEVVPIYVKFAYSDNLKAFDSLGSEIDILKVSPDFMLIYGKGDITIQNYVPFSYKYAWWISVVSLFITCGSVTYLFLKRSNISENI